MKKIVLSNLLIFSLFVVGCSNKEENEVEKVEELNTEQVKGEIEMVNNVESVNQMEQNLKSLESIEQVTKDNYKYIQKINEKINKLQDKSKIDSDLQVHINKLNEEAIKFEKEFLIKAEETVAHAFLEQALGLYAVTLEAKVSTNTVFNKSVLEVNNKKFECEVAEQKITLQRKVLAQPATEAKLHLYNGDKLIETIIVEVQAI